MFSVLLEQPVSPEDSDGTLKSKRLYLSCINECKSLWTNV